VLVVFLARSSVATEPMFPAPSISAFIGSMSGCFQLKLF
jgi:hypothetical protein